ncbi:MAG: ATP synthase F1 subunit delta [Ruminococcus sp.]|jgi:F-type H+-transporting ATPase subunit delta|nr:ATP synthase F1 subunit delta [Ruminococcus sp.]
MLNVETVYAESLFEIATENGSTDEICAETETIAKILAKETQYITLLSSPSLSKSEKCDSVDKIFSGRVSDVSLNFLKVLAAKNRMKYYGKIAAEFRKFYNKAHNLIDVTVTSATALTAEQREKLKGKLIKKYKATVNLIEIINPAVIGGLVIETGGKRIDGTVKAKLDTLQQNILTINA